MKINRKDTIFIILLLIFSLIHLFGINNPILDDETNYVEWIENPGPLITPNPFSIHPHPPLGGWIFFAAGKFFGMHTWSFRLVPMILWSINLILLYLICSRLYNKKVGLIATALMGISYYSTLMSLQIDIEGSILVTSYLLMTIFYLQAIKTKEKKYFLLTGISFGIALLTKTNSILFVFILLFHYFIVSFSITEIFAINFWKKYVYESILITIPGIIIFSSLFLLSKEIFVSIFSYSSSTIAPNISILAISMLLFWATPLFLSLSFLQSIKFEKDDLLWTLWIIIYSGVFIFLIAGRPGSHDISGGIADYSRYFMNLIIPMCVLSSKFIYNLNWSKEKKIWTLIGTIVSLILMFIVNAQTTNLIPREFNSYLQEITTGNFNFFFSFFTSSGNLLLVNMGIIILSLGIVSLATFFYLITKKKNLRVASIFLIILLSVGFAQNIFLTAEYLGPITSPDMNNEYYNLIDKIRENDLPTPIYVSEESIPLYLSSLKKNDYSEVVHFGYYINEWEEIKEELEEKEKYSIVIFNIPLKTEIILDIKSNNNCKVVYESYEKEFLASVIFVCDGNLDITII